MKTAGIEKDEIMLLLTEINNQLEQLEADLHSSTEQLKDDWYDSQINRLETCGEKLTVLENSFAENKKSENGVDLNYPLNKVQTLELGY